MFSQLGQSVQVSQDGNVFTITFNWKRSVNGLQAISSGGVTLTQTRAATADLEGEITLQRGGDSIILPGTVSAW